MAKHKIQSNAIVAHTNRHCINLFIWIFTNYEMRMGQKKKVLPVSKVHSMMWYNSIDIPFVIRDWIFISTKHKNIAMAYVNPGTVSWRIYVNITDVEFIIIKRRNPKRVREKGKLLHKSFISVFCRTAISGVSLIHFPPQTYSNFNCFG